MAKTSRKFFLSFIILILLAAVVFYFGWVQFSVPIDSVGVLISKTSGVDQEPIQSGKFMWRWERLLPTNTQIRLFSSQNTSRTVTRSGELPSGKLYASQFAEDCDFSYNIGMTLSAKINPDKLVQLVKINDFSTQADVDSYINTQLDLITDCVVEYILNRSLDSGSIGDEGIFFAPSLTSEELIKGINAESKYPDITIDSIVITTSTIPDVSLYLLAKQSYFDYQIKIQEALLGSAQENANKKYNDMVVLDQLSKLGQTLTESPILLDFFKATNKGFDDILDAVGL